MNHNLKILVADENAETLTAVKKVLKRNNFKIFSATNSTGCLEALDREKPDMVLLDVLLPGTPCKELVESIKIHPEFSSVFILLIANYLPDSDYIAEGLEGGADGYLFRPVNDRELQASISAACRVIKAERESKDALSKLRALFSAMQEGVYLHDLVYDNNGIAIDYRIIDANPASEKQLNIKTGDAIGKLASQLYGTEEVPFLEIYSKVAETGIAHSFEQYFKPMGKFFYISVYSPGQGKFATAFTDITARKLAEKVLLESESKFKNLVNDMPVGVILQNNESKILMSNPKALELLGINEAQLLGKSSFDPDWNVIHEDGTPFPGSSHPVPQAIATGQSVRDIVMGVYRPLSKDRVWLRVDAEPQFGEDGKVEQVVCSFIDISKRKRAESELNSKNDELQKMIAEKDKFFSIIAHDLRQPFNGFLGLTQIMAEGLTSLTMAEIQKISTSMRDSASNLFGLLGNLLEWSRMQRGLTVFAPQLFLLKPKVDESLVQVLEAANSKEIAVERVVPKDLLLSADVKMFSSILRNLATNAVKFTHRGGKITITAVKIEEDSVKISVADTGIGMSQHLVNGLFQLNVNTGRKGTEGEHSSGLGLIICKDFIEKHGGTLGVVSQEGIGSTFSFVLPMNLPLLNP